MQSDCWVHAVRELVLNHASVATSDLETATRWLKQLAIGMASLNRLGIGRSELRMGRHLHEIECTDRATMYDVMFSLKKSGARDEYQYLSRLSSKAPLLESVNKDVEDKFTRCEVTGLDARGLSPEDGAPLLYCAIADGIAVGFPSEPVWVQDQIDVYFAELSPDGDELGEAAESIDNLTRPEHADAISERHRANMRDTSNFGELWARRSEIFPNLLFGPDVESQLERINPSALSAITKKLSMLDGDTAKWRTANTAIPEWSCRVRPESNSIRNNPSLIEARRFRSRSGNSEIFEWHADFGYDRIHLRFDAKRREVEVGYIGPHLPR